MGWTPTSIGFKAPVFFQPRCNKMVENLMFLVSWLWESNFDHVKWSCWFQSPHLEASATESNICHSSCSKQRAISYANASCEGFGEMCQWTWHWKLSNWLSFKWYNLAATIFRYIKNITSYWCLFGEIVNKKTRLWHPTNLFSQVFSPKIIFSQVGSWGSRASIRAGRHLRCFCQWFFPCKILVLWEATLQSKVESKG